MRTLVNVASVGLGLILAGCAGSPSTPPLQSSLQPRPVPSATVQPASNKPRFDPFRDESEPGNYGRRHVIANPTIAQVMQPGPLPEMSVGRADAPITVIKYASLTCPYCRQFMRDTFPALKRTYIDTGKVRFILREFPIGFQSGAATVALRCAPRSAYFDLYRDFLDNQRAWVSQDVRHGPILKVASRHGLTAERYNTCTNDKTLVANLKQVKDRGRTLGVIGTPNFFVNGKLYKRVLTMKDFHSFVADGLANRVATAHKR